MMIHRYPVIRYFLVLGVALFLRYFDDDGDITHDGVVRVRVSGIRC